MIRCVLVAVVVLISGATASAQPPDASGRWSGYWISDKNGHTGPLKAKIRQLDADTYRASFRGRFAKVIPFWYSTKLEVAGTGDGVVILSASQQLPLMGEYRTTATVTGTNFDATFASRKDSGRFVMTRR